LIVDTGVNSRMRAALQRIGDSIPGASNLQTASPSGEARASQSVEIPTNGAGDAAVNHLLAAGFEALALLNIGLLVCGSSGELLVANETAEQVLRAGDGLALDAEGVVCATEDSRGSLGEIIRQVAETSRTGETGSGDRAIAVQRPSGKRALTLFVRAVNAKTEPPVAGKAAVLVMILDSALPAQATGAELRQLYGLTSTEAQLANLLMEGRALEECCRELGIRRTTARMHLRNIFAKTGARRQGELVSLLLKSIGLGPRVK
jgi:DNA-binding CsgD family transcriptional regulator